MTHPNPRSCVLVGGGDASFQLSKPERAMTRQGRTQAPSSSNGSPQHWLPSRSQPPPPSQGNRGLSSSLVLSNGRSPPHQAGRRQSQKQWWWQGRSRHRDRQHRGPGLSRSQGKLSVHATLGPATRWVAGCDTGTWTPFCPDAAEEEGQRTKSSGEEQRPRKTGKLGRASQEMGLMLGTPGESTV